MKIKEFDTYQAVYCGLCKQLGKAYGPFARMTLSFDFTFLSIVTLSVQDTCKGFRKEKCMVNPLKKRPCLMACDDLGYSASVAMILFYHKLKDNIQDSGLFGKLGSYLLLPFASRARKKARRLHGDVDDAAVKFMQCQAEVEQQGCDSVDRAAEPTARFLSYVLERCGRNDMERKVMSRLGYLVGRYVYLIDALDDYKDDNKSGNYNVFHNRFGQDADIEQVLEYALQVLNLTIAEIASAYELLEIKRFRPIMDNIVYLGFRFSVDTVIKKYRSEETEECDQCIPESPEQGRNVE